MSLILTIPSGFDGDLYYFCTNHSGMIQPIQRSPNLIEDTSVNLDDSNFHGAVALGFRIRSKCNRNLRTYQ